MPQKKTCHRTHCWVFFQPIFTSQSQGQNTQLRPRKRTSFLFSDCRPTKTPETQLSTPESPLCRHSLDTAKDERAPSCVGRRAGQVRKGGTRPPYHPRRPAASANCGQCGQVWPWTPLNLHFPPPPPEIIWISKAGIRSFWLLL